MRQVNGKWDKLSIMKRSSKGYGPSSMPRRRPIGERLQDEVRRLLRPSAKQFGFAIPDLLMAWSEIIGADLARRAMPEKLSRSADGAILTIRARGPAALEIQHDAPRILERLNGFLGGQAIVRLKVHQGELSLPEGRREAPRKPLDPAKAQALEDHLASVDHGDLKAALVRLGRAVLANAQK
jgi:hypothetical protein